MSGAHKHEKTTKKEKEKQVTLRVHLSCHSAKLAFPGLWGITLPTTTLYVEMENDHIFEFLKMVGRTDCEFLA